MNRAGLTTLSLIGAVLVASCAEESAVEQATTAPSIEESSAAETRAEFEAAIGELAVQWDRGFNSDDPELPLATYADDPIALPPERPPAVGAEAVRNLIEEMVAAPGVQENEVEQVWVEGDMAVARGNYTVEMPEGDEPERIEGKWVSVFTRQSDGSWKSVMNIWNTDHPIDVE